jgi:hypothetical protein
MDIKDFTHKEQWYKQNYSLHYSIEFCRWESHGERKWNIYIHVPQRSPLYKMFVKNSISDEFANVLLPNGCSYCVWKTYNESKEKYCTKTYGNDYGHIWNDYFNTLPEDSQLQRVLIDVEKVEKAIKEHLDNVSVSSEE